MEQWSHLKKQIQQWSKCQITDEEFYIYLTTHDFELDADKRVVALFVAQHDGGEWTHAIYHRNSL